MTEYVTVSFVDKNCVVLRLIWPTTDKFAENRFVSTSALCRSSYHSIDHGLLSIRFEKPEHLSPFAVSVHALKPFNTLRPKIDSESPETMKITQRKTVSGLYDENGKRCFEGGFITSLKVSGGKRPIETAPLSVLSLRVYLQFSEEVVPAAKSLSTDLLRAYHSQEGVDVTFTFKGETRELGAHKWLLCVRSDYFRRMFDARMREASTGKVLVDDFDSNIFERVLVYLYSGDYSDIGDEEWLPCLELADKYLLPKLMKVCIDKISYLLGPKNVGKVLELSHRLGCDSLLDKSLGLLSSIEELDRWKSLVGTGSFELMNLYIDYMEKFKK